MEQREKRADGRDNVRWTAVSVSCVFPSSTSRQAFNVRSSEGTDVWAQSSSGSGKRSRSVSKLRSFFFFLPFDSSLYRHPRTRPSTCGEMRNVHRGWAYRTLRLADVLHFISRWVLHFSDFYRPSRDTRVVFLPCSASLQHTDCPRALYMHILRVLSFFYTVHYERWKTSDKKKRHRYVIIERIRTGK